MDEVGTTEPRKSRPQRGEPMKSKKSGHKSKSRVSLRAKKKAMNKKTAVNKKTTNSRKTTNRKKPLRWTHSGSVRMRRVAVLWQPTPEAAKVIDACQDIFDNTPGAKGDCNKFVKAVCANLSTDPFSAGDDADKITKKIRDATWRKTNGWVGFDQDANKAKAAADLGDLVIGGATGSDLGHNHGHVVVVVSSEKLWKDYPYGSWGTLGGTGMTNAKLTLAYKLADLPKVSYMSKKI